MHVLLLTVECLLQDMTLIIIHSWHNKMCNEKLSYVALLIYYPGKSCKPWYIMMQSGAYLRMSTTRYDHGKNTCLIVK